MSNRSIPSSTVIPELAVADVSAAVDWLSRAFGFKLRVRVGGHRAQMTVGDGAIVIRDVDPGEISKVDRVMIRVEDVNLHSEQAKRAGARVVNPPADHPSSPAASGSSRKVSRTSRRRSGADRGVDPRSTPLRFRAVGISTALALHR
ncbi:MAG TPA: VOC family protein [Thermoanaerobaculia bacterium]|nr:VOC family protein [Thermoanaerobaculia bacterium]